MMSRLNKRLVRIAVGLGLLAATIAVVNAWFVGTTGRRLDRQLATIRAAGGPLSIADLAGAAIRPENNAETYLRRAAAEASAIREDLWKVVDWQEFECRPTYPIPEKVHQTLVAVFTAHPQVIPLLEQAASCPDYERSLDSSAGVLQFSDRISSDVRQFRDCAAALASWSRLKVAEGKCDEAVRSAMLILRLARDLDRNPLVIDHLLAIALRGMACDAANFALQTGSIAQGVRAALEAELASCERTDSWSRALKNDWAITLDECRRWPGRNVWLVGRPLWNRHFSDVLEGLTAARALLESDCDYRDEAQRRKTVESSLGAVGREYFGPLANCRVASLGMHAVIRSLRVVSALQTRVPEGSTEIPGLSDLGLPAEMTTDPFNGDPLHVKRLPQGWLVYSVGEDLTDDGGRLPPCRLPGYDRGVGPPPPTKPAQDEKVSGTFSS